MIQHVAKDIVVATVTLAAVLALQGQCRKPTWWLGRLVLRGMNKRHSSVTDWGLQHVALRKQFTILDVGCGGGRTIQKLAALASEGKVYGIDYSATSVTAASSTNAQCIEAGRVDIQQASVSHLPFPDATFDVVSAVETHYYWPQPVTDLREVLRVLKPGGKLVIIAETYKGRRFDAIYRPAMKLLRATYLSVDEHRDLLTAAGFTQIEVRVELSKGWICALAVAP